MEEALLRYGFEYVAADVVEDRAIVLYENRVYRYEVQALVEVLGLIVPSISGIESVTLVPLNRGIALGAITVPVAAYQDVLEGRLRPEAFSQEFEATRDVRDALRSVRKRRLNPSTFKVDLFVQPQFKAQFGSFDDAVRSQTNIVPEAEVSLWPGMRLYGQLILPVQNELDTEESKVRPGLLGFSQVLRLPRSTFLAATAGYFTDNRYGFDGEVRTYLLGGRAALGLRAGRTGYAAFRGGEWRYAGLDATTYFANALYHIPAYTLTIQAAYGQFLYEDKGWRIEVQRQFGEVEVGFFGFYTDEGRNAGFRISVPLPLAHYSQPRRVRARPAEAFRWEYRYRTLPRGAQLYQTGGELDRFMEGFVPVFVGKQSTIKMTGN